ncbi:MAG: hypothetical protein ACTH8F_04840 [Microbacterium sp.]|uniref:hypothetical protein n=1 Tax=Microbacterium sp. TaxID=51671 RepID=UPI003F9BA80B
MSANLKRVLILGRSGRVLLDTVEILRDRGFAANASNQLGTVLDDYDMSDVDLLVVGGMVPPELRQSLESEISRRNPKVQFIQGLGGIAPLLAAQVEEHFFGRVDNVQFDAVERRIRVDLARTSHVLLHIFWATFASSEPVSHMAIAFDGELAAGSHAPVIPDGVPLTGSYAVARIDGRVAVIQVGEKEEPSQQDAETALPELLGVPNAPD